MTNRLSNRGCSVHGCGQKHQARGLCSFHYNQSRRGSSILGEVTECKTCGTEIKQRLNGGGRKRLYCSKECYPKTQYERKLSRLCMTCKREKEPNRQHQVRCGECQRERSRWDSVRRHGVTKTHALEILDLQENKCPICKTDIALGAFHVDHDHDCCEGEVGCAFCVRGFLCPRCNLALGGFRDNAEQMRAGANYIEGWLLRSGNRTKA